MHQESTEQAAATDNPENHNPENDSDHLDGSGLDHIVDFRSADTNQADEDMDVLLVGSGLGTGVADTWAETAQKLAPHFRVFGVDLPGHAGAGPTDTPLSMRELASHVADKVKYLREQHIIGAKSRVFFAGVSISGALALQLGLDHSDVVDGVVVICSAAKIGEPQAWNERAELVRKAGTPVVISDSVQRWFAPGFIDTHPDKIGAILQTFHRVDRFSYARLCEVLAHFDVRERLGEIRVPVLNLQGALDPVCSVLDGEFIAESVPQGNTKVLAQSAHQAPIEEPEEVARLIQEFFGTDSSDADRGTSGSIDAGRAVRSEVLGAAHVQRAEQKTDSFTEDFQELITRYAWGTIWARPGLERRIRSAVTLTALVQGHYWEELALHLRAALRNGLSREEIKEILLQCAVYCSVPAANTAFSTAQKVLSEVDEDLAQGKDL